MYNSVQQRTIRGAIFPLIFLIILICTSCASVPKEAPVLSEQLGAQIQELEDSHLNLVRIYFDNERKQVRKFIDEKWLPAYANNFFENENIRKVWDVIVLSDNKTDRLEFIVRTAPELQKEINNKYQELIDPLDRLEDELTNSIRHKYTNAKSINNTLTSYLGSASEVEENRQRYLDMVGLTGRKVNRTINEVESFTSELTETVSVADEKILDYEEKFKNYKEKINQLLSNL